MSDLVYAYCGQRAADRKTVKGERRHALTAWSHLSGARDAECGEDGVVPVGLWDPAEPLNCPRCTAYLAGQVPIPEDVAVTTLLAAAKGPQLSLFEGVSYAA